MDHLDAAEGVDINSTMLASDAGTNLTTVAATMTAFDPATVRPPAALWASNSRLAQYRGLQARGLHLLHS